MSVKLQPFNLQQALAGKQVATRDGLPVTQLTLFTELSNEGGQSKALAGVLEGDIKFFCPNGNYWPSGDESPFDLFMAPTEYSYWVNIYPRYAHNGERIGGGHRISTTYPTKEEAREAALSDCIAQVEIKF